MEKEAERATGILHFPSSFTFSTRKMPWEATLVQLSKRITCDMTFEEVLGHAAQAMTIAREEIFFFGGDALERKLDLEAVLQTPCGDLPRVGDCFRRADYCAWQLYDALCQVARNDGRYCYDFCFAYVKELAHRVLLVCAYTRNNPQADWQRNPLVIFLDPSRQSMPAVHQRLLRRNLREGELQHPLRRREGAGRRRQGRRHSWVHTPRRRARFCSRLQGGHSKAAEAGTRQRPYRCEGNAAETSLAGWMCPVEVDIILREDRGHCRVRSLQRDARHQASAGGH